MYLYCESVKEVDVDGIFVYQNLPILINTIRSFRKTSVNPKAINTKYFVIRFIHSKNDTTDWYFENREQRDEMFRKIEDKLITYEETIIC